MSNQVLNIYQRINAVMKEVSYVQKDVTVGGGGNYRAVSHDMVLAILRPEMVKAGIVTEVRQTEGEILQKRDPNAGIKMHLYTATYEVRFVNMDNPEEFVLSIFQSHAADNGDKAPGKAASYAIKYAMLKTFGLETGENDESRVEPEHAPFTDIQKAEFDEYIESNDNGLGFLCFSKSVGEAAMEALNSSFGKGKISAGKDTVRKLEREGWDVLKASKASIEHAIANGDSSELLETISELSGVERKILGQMLEPGQIQAIKDCQKLENSHE